jgi:ABC-type lipoprotein export system ATPase subunit
MTPAIVECRGLVHIYKAAELEVVALQGLDMTVGEGEMVAIVGASGSGKTTLMNVLAAVDRPSAGHAEVGGRDLAALGERERDRYRREVVGYVWQDSMLNLTPQVSVEENLQLPLLAAGARWGARRARAEELLEAFGMTEHRRSRPGLLSGGERQRLALGVAVANRPRVLLADEPTAELDRASARQVLRDLRDLRDRDGTTVIMVTHDHEVERYADRVLRIRDGRTSTETRAAGGELVILDRAGRLQLPRSVLEETGLHDRVRVRVEDGRVVLEPGDE